MLFHQPLWHWGYPIYVHLTDRGGIETFIASFGWAAPLAFIGIQILQVLLAPVPGEATGFIGGYLFGSIPGFFYSSLALAIGSLINFSVGRLLGERYVHRLISTDKLLKFNKLVRPQGVIIIFLLFIFPGFPKDWLCLFLGITTLPLKLFMFMATIGRMPGTLLLSLQGEFLFEQNYIMLLIFISISMLLAVTAYLCRERLYIWIERANGSKKR